MDNQDTPDEVGATPSLPPGEIPAKRRGLSRIKRELTDEELTQTGVHKILIDDLEKAEAECERLDGYRTRFHDADRDLAVARAEVARLTDFDTLRSGLLGVGCLFLGFLPSAASNLWLAAVLVLAGVAMVVVSVRSKPRAK